MSSVHSSTSIVADTLVNRFKDVAAGIVARAATQETGPLQVPEQYVRLQSGLAMLAKHMPVYVIDALEVWRTTALKTALSTNAAAEGVVIRKRLAVESLFLDAVLKLLDNDVSLLEKQAANLQSLAFPWIIKAETYVPLPELTEQRLKVTQQCALIIGRLSRSRLRSVIIGFQEIMQKRLDADNAANRHELQLLCQGMRYVRLSFASDAELAVAMDLLKAFNPLKLKVQSKKSQVHHLTCDMLTAILRPAAQSGQPKASSAFLSRDKLQEWYRMLSYMLGELLAWLSKANKHYAAGYPLVTQLTCIAAQDGTFAQKSMDDLVLQRLHKLLREKVMFNDVTQRTLGLACIVQLTHSYLQHNAGCVPAAGLEAKVDAYLAPILSAARKGSLLAPDQLELLRELCVLCMDRAPAYTVERLIPEFLGAELWECMLVGLRALMDIMLRAPQRISQSLGDGTANCTHKMDKSLLTTLSSASAKPVERSLDLIRRGSHPMDVYGVPALRGSLAGLLNKIMASCLSLTGRRLHIQRSNSTVDVNPKIQNNSMQTLHELLKLVPFCEPHDWMDGTGAKTAENVALLTLHVDRDLAKRAAATLHSLLYCRPAWRNVLLAAVCNLFHMFPAEFSGMLRSTMELLVALVNSWTGHLAADVEARAADRSDAAPECVDVAMLEGCALMVLCNTSTAIRKLGTELLQCARRLHRMCTASDSSAAERGEQDRMYVATVIEQIGDTLAADHYWNFGTYSHMLREFREAPKEITFERLMNARATEESKARWACVLAQLVPHLWQLCCPSVQEAYVQIANHVQLMIKGDIKQLPADIDGQKLDQWRLYMLVLCACPPISRSAALPRKAALTMSMSQLHYHLLQVIRSGVEPHMQASLVALGGCHHGHLEDVLKELLAAYEETFQEVGSSSRLGKSKGSARREDMRMCIAHVMRLTILGLPSCYLAAKPQVATRYTAFLNATLRNVPPASASSPDFYWENQELQYCAAVVARCLADHSFGTTTPPLTPSSRKHLFDVCSAWCSDSTLDARDRMVSYALSKVKDADARAAFELDMTRCGEALRLACLQAIGSLLGGPIWESDLKHLQGRAFSWFNRMFAAPDAVDAQALLGTSPSKRRIGQRALRRMLVANPDVCNVCLNQCYTADAATANAYFHVLAEVCARLHTRKSAQPCSATALLTLVLYKIIHPDVDVRNDALELLQAVVEGNWGGAGPPGAASGALALAKLSAHDPAGGAGKNRVVVIGQLQDSYQLFQVELSSQLAREHPDLSEDLCLEMMTRQLDSEHSSTQHHVLQCLKPWMENLVLSKKWEGTWTERLLKCLYYVTWKHGQQYPYETQQLWRTVGSKPSNVKPIIDFILSKGMEECVSGAPEPLMEYLPVAKRIVLYLGQCSPQMTSDELVSECAQLINEEDESAAIVPAAVDLPTFSFQASEDAPGAASASGSIAHLQDHTAASAFANSGVMASISKFSSASLDDLQAANSGSGLQSSTSASPLVNSATSPVMRAVGQRPPSLGASSVMLAAARRSRTRSMEDPLNGRDPRPLLSRPQLTLCLLSELAYHHDEDFRAHLPVLLLICIINMDSAQRVVSAHARQVIVNLLYSMSARHLELHSAGGMSDKYARVAAVMRDLEASDGSGMWGHEESSIEAADSATYPELARLVRLLVDSMFFEPELRVKWAAEALNWSMHLPSPYLAARCQHVLRALAPPLAPEISHSMLAGLLQCLSHPSAVAFDFAAELLRTLEALVAAMPAHQVKMYPQLFWGAVALLHTSHVPLFSLVLRVLHTLLNSMQLWNLPCQQILVAAAPSAAVAPNPSAPGGTPLGPPSGVLGLDAWVLGNRLIGIRELSCLQQLLLKGLLSDATRVPTVVVLTQLLGQVGVCLRTRGQSAGMTTFQPGQRALAGGGAAAAPAVRGLDALLGRCSYQIVVSMIAPLPWVLHHRGDAAFRDEVAAFCATAGDACTAYGAPDVAPRIAAFLADASADLALPTLLSNFATTFVRAFFPEHGEVVLVYFTLQLLAGPRAYHEAVLHLLQAIFQAASVDARLFSQPASHARVLTTLSLLAQGDRAPAVLAMLDAILESVPRGAAPGLPADGAHTPSSAELDALPLSLVPISDAPLSCELAARSLQQCMQATRGGGGSVAGWRSRSPILPFTTMHLSSEASASHRDASL